MKSPISYSLKSELIPLVILISSVIASIYFYLNFPDVVATHWNMQGQVDGYAPKAFGAFFLPVLLSGLYLMFLFLPALDPKRDRYPEFASLYLKVRSGILFLLFLIYIFTSLYNIGYPIQIGIVIPLLIGSMLVTLGNFMGKIKPNWFMGIRTPWTLASDTVWNKTHRVGGYLMMLFGIIIAISPLLNQILSMLLFFSGVAALVVGTFVYSYYLYQKEKHN